MLRLQLAIFFKLTNSLTRTDFGTERWRIDDLGSGVCVFWFTVRSHNALSIDANDGEVKDILQVLCLVQNEERG